MDAKESGEVERAGQAIRAELEKMAETELRKIAKKEGIDDSLDVGEIIGLILEASSKKNSSKEEKQEFIKKTGISVSLTMLQKCPRTGTFGVIASVASTLVAIGAVVAWYYM